MPVPATTRDAQVFEDIRAIITDALNSSDSGKIAITCLAEGMVLQKELMAASAH